MESIKIRGPAKINLKFILPLSFLYLTVYLSADSIAYKIISIGTIIEPGPPLIFPLSYVIGAIIAEVYGSSISKQIIWLTLIFQMLYALFVSFIIHLPSLSGDSVSVAYNSVFGGLIHFVSSGTVAVLSSSFINIYLVAKTKVLLDGKYYCLRNILATAVGGFVLVLIIVLLVYLPVMGVKKAFHMFLFIYALEVMYTTVLVFPSWFVCGLLKKYENLDVYDYDVKFNPFKFNGDNNDK